MGKIQSGRSSGLTVFCEIAESWEKHFLRKHTANKKSVFLKELVADVPASYRQAETLSVFIKSKVDKKVMSRFPQLKLIATRSTGFDHIDLAAAKKRKITVCNVPTYGENTVAEHTFALILSLARNLRRAYLRTVQNNFSLQGLMGFDLKGKTLGVIGTGHIGLHVIRIGVGFGMRVLASDTRENRFLSEVMGFEYVPQEQVMAESDILSLHVPLLSSTKHMINQRTIKQLKKGLILINTSRGGLIETEALVEALDRGIIAGAGLDVLEEEEFLLEEKRLLADTVAEDRSRRLQTALSNHVLLNRENVIYTPHMAFYSKEAVERILETTAFNIKAFYQGTPVNQVALKKA